MNDELGHLQGFLRSSCLFYLEPGVKPCESIQLFGLICSPNDLERSNAN